VVAHRGASDAEPEHTLAAYRRALEVGADALECDVRLTADGHLVCVHDRRVDRTSNGTGLVSTLELTQLEGLDWGSWRQLRAGAKAGGVQVGGAEGRDAGDSGSGGHDPGDQDPGDQDPEDQDPEDQDPEEPDVVEPGDRSQLLTLRRLLSLVADSGPGVELAIETKHPTRYGGLVERRLVETLDRFGWAHPGPDRSSPVRVMSFSLLALRRMRQMAPGLPLVFLADRMLPMLRDGLLSRGVDTAGIGVDLLRAHPDLPHRLHQRGHAVHVWTVDDPDDVVRCLDAGVEAIITNRPQQVLRQLGR
jgi:glycerophosphoryl diester phosphodiesterase